MAIDLISTLIMAGILLAIWLASRINDRRTREGTDYAVLKTDVAVLKEKFDSLADLIADVAVLKTDVAVLKEKFDSLAEDLKELGTKLDCIRDHPLFIGAETWCARNSCSFSRSSRSGCRQNSVADPDL